MCHVGCRNRYDFAVVTPSFPSSHPHFPHSHIGVACGVTYGVVCGLLMSVLASCGGTRPELAALDSNASSTARTQQVDPGLEVMIWLTDADDRTVSDALARDPDSVPPEVDAKALARWHSSGLRLLHIPARDLPARLLAALPAQATGVDKNWLGQAYAWTPLVTGPSFTNGTPVSTDQGPRKLDAGTLRLLMRCWLAPGGEGSGLGVGGGDGVPAVLRVELIPQHMHSRNTLEPLLRPTDISALGQGEVFERLTLTMAARPGEAMVIVGEAPEAEWSSPGSAPDGPRVPTLGEAMLLGGASQVREQAGPSIPGRTRMIVLLVPRVPERFSLTRP